jgi:hypothetical protein
MRDVAEGFAGGLHLFETSRMKLFFRAMHLNPLCEPKPAVGSDG